MNKKTISSLLISVFVLTGCAGEYSAEKDFYKASKIFEHAAKNAKISPQEKLASVYAPAIHAFENLVEKYPASPKALESLFRITWMQIRLGNYREARAALQKIVSNFSQSGTSGSDARFEIGRLYELEGQWKKAEALYWETAENYPFHKKGLYAPIYILLHYENQKGDKQESAKEETFLKAKDYYESRLKKMGPIQMSAEVQNYLALLYLAHGDWQKARQVWLAASRDYPTSPASPLFLVEAADLTSQKNEAHEAIGLYRRFLKQYRNHSLAEKVTLQIGIIHLLQTKNYTQARQWLQRALDRYAGADPPARQAGIKLLIGKTYQNQKQWEPAVKIYREIEQAYPTTSAALEVPLLVWLHYDSEGETEKAQAAFKQALAHYNQLAKASPQTKLAQRAKRYRNFLYGKKGDWKQVLANMDEDIASEKRAELKANWLFEKAVITEKQLQDKTKAIDFYQDFLTRFPNHRLAGVAKTRLAVLSKE